MITPTWATAADDSPHTLRRKIVLKVLLSVASLGVAASVAVAGTYADFTASTSRGHTITTAVPQLVLGATGAATNRLGIDVTGLAPGDTFYRAFDITNSGSDTFTTYTLSTVTTTSSLLDTDTTNGVQMTLSRCSVLWTEAGSSPNYTYTCGGATTSVLTSRPLIQTNVALGGMNSAAPGGVDHVLITERLPSTADNTFQNLTSAVTYTFHAS